MRAPRAIIVAALAGLPSAVAFGQHSTAFWLNPINGSWNQAARWSGGVVPNNQGTQTFDVVINAVGSPYTVTLNARPTLIDMTLDSANATMFMNNRSITLLGDYIQRSGLLLGGATSDLMTVAGEARLEGGTIRRVKEFRSNGTLRIDVGDLIICDTGIVHGGITFTWGGAANIRMDRGARLINGINSTWNILSDQAITRLPNGDQPIVENLGVMIKSGGVGVTDIQDIRFINSGTLRIESGTVRIQDPTAVVGDRLTGGTWSIGGGSTLDFPGANIMINEAEVELTGPGAMFAAIEGLTTNEAAGRFAVSGGRDFTTVTDFTNNGTLAVGAATEFRAAPGFTLTNFAGGTLTDGSYEIGGTLRFDGADVQTLAARVALDGAGADILDQASLSGLRNFNLIDLAGDFSIANGRDFTTGGNFQNDGTLRVGDGVEFAVASGSMLTNISGDTITGGTFIVQGKVVVDADPIEVIASKITLDGPNADFESRLDAPLLESVRQVSMEGLLEVLNGRDFVTSAAADFTVQPGGALSVGEGTTFIVAPGRLLTNFMGGVFSDGDFRVAGTLEFDNAAIHTIANRLVIDNPTASIQAPGGVNALATLATITPSGSLTIRNGADLTTMQNLLTAGEFIVGPSAPMDPTNVLIGGDLTQSAGLVRIARATLELAGQFDQISGVLALEDGTLIAPGGVTLGGTLIGSGTIDGGLDNPGTIMPGKSLGAIDVTGTLTQRATGVIVIDIAGRAPVLEHDVLIADSLVFDGGSAGELLIQGLGGYRPAVGTVFDVIYFGSISGDFAIYSGLDIAPGRTLVPSIENGFIRLTTTIPSPGVGAVMVVMLAAAGGRRRR